MDKDPDMKGNLWPPNVIAGYNTNGQQWGLPFMLYPFLYWFNADLFAQAGLANPNELGENWTWETMRSAAKKITRDENGDGEMDYYGIDHLWTCWNNGAAVLQAGGMLYNRWDIPTESLLNTPEVRTALEFLTNLYLNDRVTPPYDAPSALITEHYIWNGKTGMAVHWGPTVIGTYFKNANFNWDIALPVKGPKERGTTFTNGGIHIHSTTKHPEEAYRWIKFLTTNKEVVDKMVEMSGVLPALRSSFATYTKHVSPLPPSINNIYETMMLPTTHHNYLISAPGASTHGSIMGPVFTGQKSPAVALQEAHELSQKAFAEYAAQQAGTKQ